MIHLGKVLRNYERRTRTFLDLYRSLSLVPRREADRIVAYLSMEMQTGIGYVSRSAYLAGTIGGKRANGVRLTGSFATALDALTAGAKLFKKSPRALPGRDEPTWSSEDHLQRLAQSVSLANGQAFIAATSAYPDAMRVMKELRNFYAHRGRDTLARLVREALSSQAVAIVGHPTIYFVKVSRSPASVFERWIANYRDIAELLCEL